MTRRMGAQIRLMRTVWLQLSGNYQLNIQTTLGFHINACQSLEYDKIRRSYNGLGLDMSKPLKIMKFYTNPICVLPWILIDPTVFRWCLIQIHRIHAGLKLRSILDLDPLISWSRPWSTYIMVLCLMKIDNNHSIPMQTALPLSREYLLYIMIPPVYNQMNILLQRY